MRLLLVLLVVAFCIGPALGVQLQCQVKIQTFDSKGNQVGTNLLDVENSNYPGSSLTQQLSILTDKSSAKGIVIEFPKRALGARFKVFLRTESGAEFSEVIPIQDCNQSVSLVVNESDSGNDVRNSVVKGVISGCNCGQGFWLRAVPMFGGLAKAEWAEALVDPKDCSFAIPVSGRGIRFVFVLGVGMKSLATFDANIVRGGDNNLGNISLLGKGCR